MATLDEVEELVRPHGNRDSILTVRVRFETLSAIDFYARAKNWTRADATRHLLRAALAAEGY